MSKKQERILLVEEDEETIDLIAHQTLMSLGYQVDVVGKADAAIRESVVETPHVIIVSLDLPDLSGKDLLVALSSQGIRVPVIVIGGQGNEKDIIQAFRLGAWDYLSRPIREAEVASTVERALTDVRERREQERLVRELEETNRVLRQQIDSLQDALDRAQRSESLKVGTLRNVGRELSSPLISAVDYVENLIGNKTGNLTEEQIRVLDQLYGNLGHMNTIVTAMSGLEEERSPQKLEVVNLDDLAREAVHRFYPLVQAREIEMEAEILPEPLLVDVDKSQVVQVFDTLLANALRNLSKGEKVTLAVERTLDGEHAHVKVQDTGPGIAENDLANIFEPFHRNEVKITNRRESVGIGLSIAKEIIIAHGGRMWAESKIGEGSSFHFNLPLSK